MVERFRRRRISTLTAATAAAIALMMAMPAASAFAVVNPAPIGPGQYFTGLVNGTGSSPVIQMACAGPVGPGQTGHPLAGQTVEVLPASAGTTADIGYTGTAANSIDVEFGPTSTTAPIVLTSYNVQAAIPTSLVLPCSGTGTVAFVPDPTSSTAKSAILTVTFIGQP